jgi:periplasmic protein TonB
MKNLLYILLLTVSSVCAQKNAAPAYRDTVIGNRLYVKPKYPGGQNAFYDLIKCEIRSIKTKKIQVINIVFFVDEDGSTSNISVTGDTEPKTERKIRRIIKKSRWSPGIVDGRPTKTRLGFPMTVEPSE